MNFTVGEHRQLIPGPAGDLEAVISIKKDAQMLVVCCHPHPLYGGTMTNKVVHTLHRTFSERNMNTIRFNFRGVGRSHGTYAEGIGEVDDLNAVIRWAKDHWKNLTLALAGFSFGAFVSLKASSHWPLSFLVSVAPPVERFPLEDNDIADCSWVLIQPMADEVVDVKTVIQWFESLARKQAKLIKIAEASHFFHGKLLQLKKQLNLALDEFRIRS